MFGKETGDLWLSYWLLLSSLRYREQVTRDFVGAVRGDQTEGSETCGDSPGDRETALQTGDENLGSARFSEVLHRIWAESQHPPEDRGHLQLCWNCEIRQIQLDLSGQRQQAASLLMSIRNFLDRIQMLALQDLMLIWSEIIHFFVYQNICRWYWHDNYRNIRSKKNLLSINQCF